MSRSIYWKIITPFTLIVLIGMGILGYLVVESTRSDQINSLRRTLLNEARLVSDAVSEAMLNEPSIENINPFARQTGSDVTARVTIINVEGKVLGDSWEDPATMGNHRERPEIKEALATGEGESTRYSTTFRENFMYVAVPVVRNGETLGVARTALSLSEIEASVNNTLRTIILSVVIVTIVVILAAALVTRMILRSVSRATRAAEMISSGNFEHKIKVDSHDEMGRLGNAFNAMADNVREMMLAISEEKGKLSTVLGTMADGVILTDSRGKILLANKAAEDLLKFNQSAAEGKPLIESVINHKLEDVLKKCLETRTRQLTQIDTAEGRFVRVIAAPLRSGKMPGALLLLQDLTEVRSLQTMRREFVGNISHELKTPLAGMKAIVETLIDGAIEDRQTTVDFLNRMNGEVDNMTHLIDELIELSRIETGNANLNLMPVDLNFLVRESAERLAPMAERKQINLKTVLTAELPTVPADRDRIQQVISNMIHNAIKFNREKGEVKITTSLSGDSVTVQIADSGAGISKDDLPHIFERFFKADKSRSSLGSGLGLAIARHIVQAHKGKIWVESQEGKGSVFSFSLPVKG